MGVEVKNRFRRRVFMKEPARGFVVQKEVFAHECRGSRHFADSVLTCAHQDTKGGFLRAICICAWLGVISFTAELIVRSNDYRRLIDLQLTAGENYKCTGT